MIGPIVPLSGSAEDATLERLAMKRATGLASKVRQNVAFEISFVPTDVCSLASFYLHIYVSICHAPSLSLSLSVSILTTSLPLETN